MKVQNQDEIINEIDRYFSEICFSILEDEEDNKMVENLQQIYGTTNLTDTVYRALENENANSQS